jgi:hypothetical protein
MHTYRVERGRNGQHALRGRNLSALSGRLRMPGEWHVPGFLANCESSAGGVVQAADRSGTKTGAAATTAAITGSGDRQCDPSVLPWLYPLILRAF